MEPALAPVPAKHIGKLWQLFTVGSRAWLGAVQLETSAASAVDSPNWVGRSISSRVIAFSSQQV